MVSLEKKFYLINERIDMIQSMSGNNVELITDFKNSSESHEYPSNIEDIRELLPKKYL
jgi:hypothetical protein